MLYQIKQIEYKKYDSTPLVGCENLSSLLISHEHYPPIQGIQM